MPPTQLNAIRNAAIAVNAVHPKRASLCAMACMTPTDASTLCAETSTANVPSR